MNRHASSEVAALGVETLRVAAEGWEASHWLFSAISRERHRRHR